MHHTALRLLVLATVFAATGCSPRDYLREDYVGKAYLQPDRFPQKVKHDNYGNAIVETERRRGLLSNLPSFGLPPGFFRLDLPDIDLPDLWPFDDDEEKADGS